MPADSVVLTSATFLADITRNVAGERLDVESLLPVGADPHSYQPTPRDVTKIVQSQLLIINGAEYEHFLEPLLENAEGEREVVEASAGLKSAIEAHRDYITAETLTSDLVLGSPPEAAHMVEDVFENERVKVGLVKK